MATVGRMGDATHAMGRDWLSRRHYVEVAAARRLSVRAGRFLLAATGIVAGTGEAEPERGVSLFVHFYP